MNSSKLLSRFFPFRWKNIQNKYLSHNRMLKKNSILPVPRKEKYLIKYQWWKHTSKSVKKTLIWRREKVFPFGRYQGKIVVKLLSREEDGKSFACIREMRVNTCDTSETVRNLSCIHINLLLSTLVRGHSWRRCHENLLLFFFSSFIHLLLSLSVRPYWKSPFSLLVVTSWQMLIR